MAVKGAKVSLIDESVRMAITLKPDIARTYPNVSALREDEPLLDLEPFDVSISNASYIFYAPRIRKVGADAKGDVGSKFKDAVKSIRKGSSVLYMLPVGLNGNAENIQIIEHVTGMSVSDGKDVSYYYMPANSQYAGGPEFSIGSIKAKQDNVLARVLHDPDIRKKVSFIDLNSSELAHVIRTLGHYSGIASVLEVCKKATADLGGSTFMESTFGDLYLDDVANGLYDLRIIGSSLDGGGPLMYLVNGTIRGIEGYLKHLIDNIRNALKLYDLKASRTKVSIAWALDPHEMRGDKIELLSVLEERIKDYIGDVERQQTHGFDPYNADKTTIALACSKSDFERMNAKKNNVTDLFIMKANPLCQIFVNK
jgi:hypothetical protein